jgi:hypothetical protein
LRRRSEHDAYSSFVQVKRQIHLQAKSTAQSANREKSPKLAFEPDETGSLVDLERRIPAQCAFFTQLMRESWQPEDSLAEQSEFELSGDF